MKIIQCNLCGAHIRSVSLSNHLKTRLHLKRMQEQKDLQLNNQLENKDKSFAHFIATSLSELRKMEFEKETSNIIDDTVIPSDAFQFEDGDEEETDVFEEPEPENIVLEQEIMLNSVWQCQNVLSLPLKHFPVPQTVGNSNGTLTVDRTPDQPKANPSSHR